MVAQPNLTTDAGCRPSKGLRSTQASSSCIYSESTDGVPLLPLACLVAWTEMCILCGSLLDLGMRCPTCRLLWSRLLPIPGAGWAASAAGRAGIQATETGATHLRV
jgi:hypothetical protein